MNKIETYNERIKDCNERSSNESFPSLLWRQLKIELDIRLVLLSNT